MVLQQIDEILLNISHLNSKINKIRERWDKAIAELERQYGSELNEYKKRLRQKENELMKLVRRNRADIFDGTDRKELKNGVLYLAVSERVRRSRGVTCDLLKRLGYQDAIKVIEKVDWEKIETWPDEKLVAIGTERVRKEDIKYEVRTV